MSYLGPIDLYMCNFYNRLPIEPINFFLCCFLCVQKDHHNSCDTNVNLSFNFGFYACLYFHVVAGWPEIPTSFILIVSSSTKLFALGYLSVFALVEKGSHSHKQN